jgi:hypothetical protein
MKPLFSAILVGFGLSVSLSGACQDSPDLQRAEMNKLASWVGEWKGTGWMMVGPGQRHTSIVTEKVTSKLDGMVYIIEGRGVTKTEDGKERVVHDALGILSYDMKAKLYRLRTHEVNGRSMESELKMIDGGMQWGFKEPQRNSTVRFTVKMDGKTWNEIGEISLDGTTWLKFMEMTLQKQGATTAGK